MTSSRSIIRTKEEKQAEIKAAIRDGRLDARDRVRFEPPKKEKPEIVDQP